MKTCSLITIHEINGSDPGEDKELRVESHALFKSCAVITLDGYSITIRRDELIAALQRASNEI